MASQIRSYNYAETVAFRTVRGAYGILSNFAPTMIPMAVSTKATYRFSSSEALYQALKFPESPAVQLSIFKADSAYNAKQLSRANETLVTPTWHASKVRAMTAVLWFKAVSDVKFADALRNTGDKDIVEHSDNDPFWGCRKELTSWVGVNALGRLLMATRSNLDNLHVAPNTEGFVLFGQPLATYATAILARKDPQCTQPSHAS